MQPPVPAGVGDFGAGAIEVLGTEDVFVALVEYGSDLADEGLFERQGWPRLAPSQFSTGPDVPRDPGRSASQHFFTAEERAFCLFTVVGSHSRRMATVPRAADRSCARSVPSRPRRCRAGGGRVSTTTTGRTTSPTSTSPSPTAAAAPTRR